MEYYLAIKSSVDNHLCQHHFIERAPPSPLICDAASLVNHIPTYM